jgi:hypothetical protein
MSGTGGTAPVEGTPIGSFTGVNGLIADDPANLAPLGWVREYHNWGWICDNYAAGPAYPGMLYTFMNFNGCVPGAATMAKAVALMDKQPNGMETNLAISGGAVTLDLGESPTIVLLDSL